MSLDLKDAYFHVRVIEDSSRSLCFAFNSEVYEYRILPFGLSTAPHVFTCIVLVLAAFIKAKRCDFPVLDWFILGRWGGNAKEQRPNISVGYQVRLPDQSQ